ncbi:MAG: SsrA-binding protein SmpB [Chitinivibrionales bacterium]
MKTITRNKKAFHDYDILKKYESGIELFGTEVKSIRAGRINLLDSYGINKRGEVYLKNLHISTFREGNQFNHEPYRERKLLLHKREVSDIIAQMTQKKLTLIPLSVYFKNQWCKIEVGICRGRKKYDKRNKIAEKEAEQRIKQLKRSRMKRGE